MYEQKVSENGKRVDLAGFGCFHGGVRRSGSGRAQQRRIRCRDVHHLPAGAGRQVGHEMGFPTANIPVPEGIFLPPFGVYAAYFQWQGGFWPAVVNVGVRPTFGLKQPVAEAHLLDFEGDLYGEKATIHFVSQIRRERPFPDLQTLIDTIADNKNTAARLLKERQGLRFFPKIDACAFPQQGV